MQLTINRTVYGKKVNESRTYEGGSLVEIVFDQIYRSGSGDEILESIVAEAHDAFMEEKCECVGECECDHDALWEEFRNLPDLENRLRLALQGLASTDNWEFEIGGK